ncbi:MAG: hypothetical protein H6822_27810 [Planctomycetaceae bacterium]|nr:hypothetical protein [Planctomycetales bacterium]MCB9925987.1 hypothetical protein [Planctomycetaceae bacterium]
MLRVFGLSLLLFALVTMNVSAQEPGWWGVVIAPEAMRPQIQSTPITQRPYRPFHFYGNTVRRQYYRGTIIPAPRDVIRGGGALLRGR